LYLECRDSEADFFNIRIFGHATTDESFRWLDCAFKEMDYSMVRLKINPYLKPLHSDPRWQEMLDKVGFPD
jgi:hypothetical protein